MIPADAELFCTRLRKLLSPGDLLLIGFDLKKHPKIILDAYNDKQGFTRRFNLNLLTRINTELDADFNIARFEHYPTYDPETGACKSYLISLEEQQVNIGNTKINFSENEHIFMEISQKYTIAQTDQLAQKNRIYTDCAFLRLKKMVCRCIMANKPLITLNPVSGQAMLC